jgi:hypothetical protein
VIYLVYSCASSLSLEEHSALRRGRTASFDKAGEAGLVRVLSERRGSGLEELSPAGPAASAGSIQGVKAVQLV